MSDRRPTCPVRGVPCDAAIQLADRDGESFYRKAARRRVHADELLDASDYYRATYHRPAAKASP